MYLLEIIVSQLIQFPFIFQVPGEVWMDITPTGILDTTYSSNKVEAKVKDMVEDKSPHAWISHMNMHLDL